MHEDYVAFSGDARRAFDIALQTLLPLGFGVVSQSASRLVVSGPGFNSTRQNALLGISHAEFTAERGSLAVKAELGGIDRFQKMMMVLLIGVGAFDSLLQFALWYFIDELHTKTWFLAVPVLVFIPWVLFAPFLVRWILKRTIEALNALLRNMVVPA